MIPGPEPGSAADPDPGADGGRPRARRRARPATPGLAESMREVADAGKAGIGAAGDAAKALRSLITADISLARSAFGRTLALTGVAIAFGASAWLLLMSSLVMLLGAAGLPWIAALMICAVLSGAAAAWAIWQAQRYFSHTRLQATRRQLARLGIGELAEFVPEAGSPASTRDAGEQAPTERADGDPVKDARGVDITPP